MPLKWHWWLGSASVGVAERCVVRNAPRGASEVFWLNNVLLVKIFSKTGRQKKAIVHRCGMFLVLVGFGKWLVSFGFLAGLRQVVDAGLRRHDGGARVRG
jgi:hypothetical protein